jgi:hypothetical protein
MFHLQDYRGRTYEVSKYFPLAETILAMYTCECHYPHGWAFHQGDDDDFAGGVGARVY